MEPPNVSDIFTKKDDLYFTVHTGMGHFSNIFPYWSQFITSLACNQEDSILIRPITVKTSYKPADIVFNEETSTDRHDLLKMWDSHNTNDTDQNIEDIIIHI